jgi:hypothetical protein
MQPLALADEKLGADIVLELADARGHVRLDTMKALRSPGDPALANDRAEDLQIR